MAKAYTCFQHHWVLFGGIQRCDKCGKEQPVSTQVPNDAPGKKMLSSDGAYVDAISGGGASMGPEAHCVWCKQTHSVNFACKEYVNAQIIKEKPMPMCADVVGAVVRLVPAVAEDPNTMAGHSLNAAIAKEIFGCHVVMPEGDGVYECGCKEQIHSVTDDGVIMNYGVNMHMAMNVVEQMGCGFALNWVHEAGKEIWLACFQASGVARAETAALAICRAALLRRRSA